MDILSVLSLADHERVKQMSQRLAFIVIVEFNDLKHYVLETSDWGDTERLPLGSWTIDGL